MKKYSSNFLEITVIFFKWIGIIITIIIVLFLIVVFMARGINKNKTKIATINGIQESTYVEIGGIEQYIQIRGEDTNNPVMIFLHGGPGSPHAYTSYYYQGELEADYTMVNWDQRGCGRTYYATSNSDVETELSVEILLDDLNELVDYLTDRFGQDKVIIMGHSWGTVLGSIYAKEYPEKVSAYVGVGKTVNMLKAETLAVNRAKKLAIKSGNEEDIEKISELLNKIASTKNYKDFDFNSLMDMRNLTSQYLLVDNPNSTFKTIWIGISSPDMSMRDIKWFMKPIFKLEEFLEIEKSLFEYLFFDFNIYDYGMEYEVPVYFISGDCDWITPYLLVEEYYESIKAPNKKMLLIDKAGHMTFMDNPKEFSDAIKSVLE